MLSPDRKEIVGSPLTDSRPGYNSWLKRLPGSVRMRYAVGAIPLSLLAAACTPEAKPSTSEPNAATQSAATQLSESNNELSFRYPFSGLWYLTAGPHSDGLTDGVRAGLDFAQPEVVACPGGKLLDHRFVEASASGKVAVVGNEKDSTDKNHSIVEIDHDQGLRTGYMHLANIPVMVGQEVKQGERLGNPSCEKPPGGDTTGVHLHWYAKKDGKFLPADGIKFPQGQIKASPNNRDGILTGPDNLVRTADKRRCGPDENSIKSCGGIRNDLDKGAVLGKVPQSPITYNVKFCMDSWYNSCAGIFSDFSGLTRCFPVEQVNSNIPICTDSDKEYIYITHGRQNTGITLKAGQALEISAIGKVLLNQQWYEDRYVRSCEMSNLFDPDGHRYWRDKVCPPVQYLNMTDNPKFPSGSLIGLVKKQFDASPDSLIGSHWKGSFNRDGGLMLYVNTGSYHYGASGGFDITVIVYPSTPKPILTPESVQTKVTPPSATRTTEVVKVSTDKNPDLASWVGGLGAALFGGLAAYKLFERWKLSTKVAAGATTGTGSTAGSTPRIGGVAGTIGGPSNPNTAPSTAASTRPTQPKSPEWIIGQQEFEDKWQSVKSKLLPIQLGETGNEPEHILDRFKTGMNIVHEVSLGNTIPVPKMAVRIRAGIEYLIPKIWPNNRIFQRFFDPSFNAGYLTPDDFSKTIYLPEQYRSLSRFTEAQRKDIRRIHRILIHALHPDTSTNDATPNLKDSIDDLLKKFNPAWSYIDRLIK